MIYLKATLPIVIGFIIDAILGDPYSLPHPVRLIGTLITKLECSMRKHFHSNDRIAGTILTITVSIISFIVPLIILMLCYHLNIILGLIFESIMCYYLLAAKCLKSESMKVYSAVEENDIEKARYAVSMIVGRDTECLDEKGIIKATVETVAENTSDGVTAPMFWIMLGGAPFGFLYKSVNTMDSMIGYKNDKYIKFGRLAAKLDDILNFIPARLTALIMIFSAFILNLDGKTAFKIWKRDRYNHASPNSAQTEAVCAGALNIQLAGDAYYFGKLCKKKIIGDNVRIIENADIKRSNKLMYCTSIIMLVVTIFIKYLLTFLFGGIIC